MLYAEKIFHQLYYLHHWRHWSPWEELDPNLQRDYSGPESGVGAVYAWQGNKKVGKGRMEIITSTEPQYLRIQLDFIEPFPANNIAEFSLQRIDNSIRINWSMDGKNIFISKIMSVFINMDKLIGKDFEKGLNNLKHYCESAES